jgi:cellulose synthase/poly-beta-1,6-N-acetylglucosamine synthase-like glycosyltransferase
MLSSYSIRIYGGKTAKIGDVIPPSFGLRDRSAEYYLARAAFMGFIIVFWSVAVAIFLGVPSVYHLFMKKRAVKPWNLNIDETYEPSVSILVPAHNEEKTIRLKLKNLQKVVYPAEKLEIIVVNDASTDKTLDEINRFLNSHPALNIKVLNRIERVGKSNALNFALKHANGDVIVVSDADCFLSSDTLTKALPYLSDSNVGAVAGREILLNPQSSWVTKSELFFNNFVQPQRLGESKVYSTIFFQGGFAAYKKTCLDEFDQENDDSGTAFNIVQGKKRTLIVPEARFYTMFPVDWKNKVLLKIRRAKQLQQIWIRCLKFSLNGKLVLPRSIAIPEIFLQIFNPLVFLALLFLTSLVILEQPLISLFFISIVVVLALTQKGRIALIESFQNYFILLIALFSLITRRQFTVWKTADESRLPLNEKILQEKHLI